MVPKPARNVLVYLVALCACGRAEAPARGDAPGEVRAAAPAPAAAPTPGPLVSPVRGLVGFEAALGAGIRRRDEGGFEVDSFVAAAILEELTAGAGPIVVAHSGEGGGVDGFELRGVGEGSMYARLGLADGDVVASVNGVALTSPGRAIAALSSVRRRVVIEVVRGGVATSSEFRLVDGLAWSQTLAERGSPEPEPAVAAAPSAVVPVDEAMLDGAPAAVEAPGRSEGTAASKSGGGGGASKSGSGGASKSGSGGASKSGGSGSAPTTTASCSSATSCTIRRAEVSSLLDSPERAMSQARVVPDLAGGEVRGYKLFGVRKGTTVDGLGFRNGDVIRSVNGYDLGDDADALGLYMSLPGASTFRVNYVRGGLASIKVIKVI